jgi:hypothetical protein
MTAFVFAIIGIIFGAWINNILLWKIKQKIEHLDILLRDALDYNSKFLEFIRLKCLNIDPTEEDYVVFGKYSQECVNNGYMGNYIIYGSPKKCKDTELYRSMFLYYDFIAKILNDRNVKVLRDNFFLENGDKSTEILTEYEHKMHDCINTILCYRNKLTSLDLRFWLQELICDNRCKL